MFTIFFSKKGTLCILYHLLPTAVRNQIIVKILLLLSSIEDEEGVVICECGKCYKFIYCVYMHTYIEYLLSK